MNVARKGMTILVTETTGSNGAMFAIGADGNLKEIPLSKKARAALKAISDSCEPSRVSGIYTAGAGGSARAGVTKYPIKLTQAVHAGKAHLTVGGSPGFVCRAGAFLLWWMSNASKPDRFTGHPPRPPSVRWSTPWSLRIIRKWAAMSRL
jgi:hypothetical protein